MIDYVMIVLNWLWKLIKRPAVWMMEVKAEKNFVGDPIPYTNPQRYYTKPNSMWENMWLDIKGKESSEVWRYREDLEDYFEFLIGVGWATCWVFGAGLLLVWKKSESLEKSKKRTDHRRPR